MEYTNIFTKKGDRGTTTLKGMQNVSKTDSRIQLLGTIDELTSNLGLIKAESQDAKKKEVLEEIQKTLMTIMASIADAFNQKFRLSKEEVLKLEREINAMEEIFPRKHEFVLPGGSLHSAHWDVARTVARRAERCLHEVAKSHSVDGAAKEYMNRLSDFLYVSARLLDYQTEQGKDKKENVSQIGFIKNNDLSGNNRVLVEEAVKKALEGNMTYMNKTRISLKEAKLLIDKIEDFAKSKNKNAVISVCGPDGNMIAVHVMEDAFLASFDISMKKAYTSVAVKMSTMELSKLAQPGQTFYGVESTDGGRIVIFGGGIPLKLGGKIIGGLGVSGGTGEEDHEIASYGAGILEEVIDSLS